MEEKNNNKGLIWILITLIIIIFGIVGYLIYDDLFLKISDKTNNNSEININNYNIELLYDGKKGDKKYFYKNKLNYGSVLYLSSDNKLESTEDIKYTQLGEYVCKYDGCSVLDVSNESYAIIYDKDYVIYDIKKQKINKTLNIEKIKYNSIKGLHKKNGDIVFVVLQKEPDNYEETYRLSSALYGVANQEIVIDYGTYSDIQGDDVILEKGFVVCTLGFFHDDDYRADLYNLKKNKVEKNNINGFISGKNVVYYYYGEIAAGVYINKIYDENFNVIYESKNNEDITEENYYITNEDKLILKKDNKFYIYDNNYNLEYTSKEYKQIYNIFKDYIAINENDKLKIIDYKEQEKAELCELSDKNYVHSMISGWYTENGKNGIYMVISDANAFSEISQEVKDSWGITEENLESVGYEYYYIPSTGEIGKIAAPIGGYAKPVLYLYPIKNKTLINVTFEKPQLLTTTYPKYIDSWSVIANKNGDLIDKNGRNYYALYWEEIGNTNIDFSEGFYVERENAIDFLENKLDEIGLNQREANEFIMYWLPVLEKNEKSLVYFELTEERQMYNRINISPKVDSLLRVAIHIKKTDNPVNIKKQTFDKFDRKGFTAIEWGGYIHK